MLAFAFMLLEVGSSLMPAGFVPLSKGPSATDFQCANYSKAEWSVTASDGGLQVSARAHTGEQQDPLPFGYGRHTDRSGRRHVTRVSDGWLVGFDAGEF